MEPKEHIEYWLKSAGHDLESAETLFEQKRYDWCLFLGHLVIENMLKACRAGARIVPAMPAFYQKPDNFDDLGDFIAGRVLNLLGVEHDLFKSWKGR